MDTTIHIHHAAIRARIVNQTIWLDVPLSDDGTAHVAIYLSEDAARTLGADLQTVADRVQRIAAIEAEGKVA